MKTTIAISGDSTQNATAYCSGLDAGLMGTGKDEYWLGNQWYNEGYIVGMRIYFKVKHIGLTATLAVVD